MIMKPGIKWSIRWNRSQIQLEWEFIIICITKHISDTSFLEGMYCRQEGPVLSKNSHVLSSLHRTFWHHESCPEEGSFPMSLQLLSLCPAAEVYSFFSNGVLQWAIKSNCKRLHCFVGLWDLSDQYLTQSNPCPSLRFSFSSPHFLWHCPHAYARW